MLIGAGGKGRQYPSRRIAAALDVLLKVKTNINLSQLTRVCKLAEQISGYKNQGTKAVTGDYYFMMEPGVTIHAVETMRKSGLGSKGIIGAIAPEMIGKKGYEYILGKESGAYSIRVFLNRLA